MSLETAVPVCLCEWEDTGDVENGPHVEITDWNLSCPFHGAITLSADQLIVEIGWASYTRDAPGQDVWTRDNYEAQRQALLASLFYGHGIAG